MPLLVFRTSQDCHTDKSFQDPDELIEALTNLFDSMTFEETQSVFHNWTRRLRWVIEKREEYFHE
jgi:hypothetical protein